MRDRNHYRKLFYPKENKFDDFDDQKLPMYMVFWGTPCKGLLENRRFMFEIKMYQTEA